jgi:hypothetical protein
MTMPGLSRWRPRRRQSGVGGYERPEQMLHKAEDVDRYMSSRKLMLVFVLLELVQAASLDLVLLGLEGGGEGGVCVKLSECPVFSIGIRLWC